MNAIVWPNRIDILGSTLEKRLWEPLLDELNAEHVPSFTPTGKRLSVVVSPRGRLDAFIYRTRQIGDDVVIRILAKYGIPAALGEQNPAWASSHFPTPYD